MLAVVHLHFGTACRPRHGLPIKMGSTGCPETSVNCQNMLRYLPEGQRPHSMKFHANLTSGNVLIHADRRTRRSQEAVLQWAITKVRNPEHRDDCVHIFQVLGGCVRDYADTSNENRWISAAIFTPPPHTQLE